MKIFKSYTYEWWQIGIFKLGMISIGVILGSYFCDLFSKNLIFLSILAIISNIYIIYISIKK
jgi:hypothetical protein